MSGEHAQWGSDDDVETAMGQAKMSHQKAADFSQFQECSQPLKISLALLLCSGLLCF